MADGSEKGSSSSEIEFHAPRLSNIVVKIGGNALMARGSPAPSNEITRALISFSKRVTEYGNKIVLLPGGVGGQVHLEWARSAGCPDALMNKLGCNLIDMAAEIFADQFYRECDNRSTKVSPIPAESYSALLDLVARYDVVVSGYSIQGAVTSDSLGMLIAEALRWPIMLVKQHLPFLDISTTSTSETATHDVLLSSIISSISSMPDWGRPGWHPSLDNWALAMLRRGTTNMWITTGDALVKSEASGQNISPLMRVVTHE